MINYYRFNNNPINNSFIINIPMEIKSTGLILTKLRINLLIKFLNTKYNQINIMSTYKMKLSSSITII
jgi:hypothetical protein